MNGSSLTALAAVTAALTLPFSPFAATSARAQEATDPTVATVGGMPIQKSELDRMILLHTDGQGLDAIPEEMRPEARRQILDGLIADRLVAEAADAANITVPEQDLEKFIAEVEGQVGGRENLEKELAQSGVSLTKFREDALKNMKKELWMKSQIDARAGVTDAEIEEFYKSTPQASKMPERVRASHILLVFDKDAKDPAAAEEARLKEITAIRDKIVGGEDFAMMAKMHSEDPGSKDLGGDLNYFTRGRMVKEFEDAAFALEVGQVSGPVKTEYGYHLIKVMDHQPARDIPLEEAKSSIRSYLQNRKRQQAMRQVVEELRAKADVKVLLN